MLWRESESGTRQILEEALEEHGVLDSLNILMELGSHQSIKSAVEAGLGIGFLPRLTVSKELQYGILLEVTIADFHIKRDLWLVKKNQRFQKNGLQLFLETIEEKEGGSFA